MYSQANSVALHRLALPLVLSWGLLASACAGDDPMTGTWVQPDATTTLPDVLGGGVLDIDATWELDGRASTPTFHLTMDLETSGLMDTIEAEGTYVDAGDELTLTVTGFVIDPESPNTSLVAEDGSQCIVLEGFLSTPVCFRAPQTNPYAMDEESLTLTLDHSIAGAAESQTIFTLTRAL